MKLTQFSCNRLEITLSSSFAHPQGSLCMSLFSYEESDAASKWLVHTWNINPQKACRWSPFTQQKQKRKRFLPAATKLWPRLCFYKCVWFCSQGGSLGSPPWAGRPPPRPGRPPRQGESPPRPGRPPRTRQTPPHPRPGRPPPAGKKTAAYGQWAASTHPTGMHSCFLCLSFVPFCQFFDLFRVWMTWTGF